MKKRGPFPRQPRSITVLYDQANLDADTRRSLGWILGGNMFGNLFGIICGGGTAAMVGLAGHLGAGDMEFGLLAAIPQVAALLQIPFSLMVNRSRKRKIWLLTVGLFSRAVWILFGLLPLLNQVPDSRLPLYSLIGLLALSSACGAVINVVWFPWFSDLAPIQIRGRWLSRRDMIINVLSLGFGLLVGWLLDVLGMPSRYVIIFALGGVLGCLDMLCFGFAREVWKVEPRKIRMRKAVGDVLRNRPYMRLTLMWTAWCFTANMSGAYLVPYAMNTMGLSALQITVYGTVAAALSTVLMVPKWGGAVDQFGSRNVMLVSCIGASLTPLFFLLSTPGSIWPTLLHNLVGAFFWCGANLAANSQQLFASPDDERSTYIAFYSAVTCLAGTALGTLCGGWLLEGFRTAGLFTGWFDRYKVVITISVALRFALVLLLVPGMSNENDHTAGELVKDMKLVMLGQVRRTRAGIARRRIGRKQKNRDPQ